MLPEYQVFYKLLEVHFCSSAIWNITFRLKHLLVYHWNNYASNLAAKMSMNCNIYGKCQVNSSLVFDILQFIKVEWWNPHLGLCILMLLNFISYTDVILNIHVDENIHRNATQKSLILTMLGLEITIISNSSTTDQHSHVALWFVNFFLFSSISLINRLLKFFTNITYTVWHLHIIISVQQK